MMPIIKKQRVKNQSTRQSKSTLGECTREEEITAVPPVTALLSARLKHLKLQRLSTELTLYRTVAAQFQVVVQPDIEHGVDKVLHHVSGVVWCRGDTEKLLSAGDRRVVDGLYVDAVLLH